MNDAFIMVLNPPKDTCKMTPEKEYHNPWYVRGPINQARVGRPLTTRSLSSTNKKIDSTSSFVVLAFWSQIPYFSLEQGDHGLHQYFPCLYEFKMRHTTKSVHSRSNPLSFKLKAQVQVSRGKVANSMNALSILILLV